jgi:hypothetical protein
VAQVRAIALRSGTVERHREALENLRRLELQLQTAAALERRADLSANPTFAAVLRERAQERRRIAEVVRAHLVEAETAARPDARRPPDVGRTAP